jgi:hypothetical protein
LRIGDAIGAAHLETKCFDSEGLSFENVFAQTEQHSKLVRPLMMTKVVFQSNRCQPGLAASQHDLNPLQMCNRREASGTHLRPTTSTSASSGPDHA